MIFYCLESETGLAEQSHFLRQACDVRSIEYISIDPLLFDEFSGRLPSTDDLFYRIAIGTKARLLESRLLLASPATFYGSLTRGLTSMLYPTLVYQLHHIPIPPTLYFPAHHLSDLEKHVEQIGGFPLVIKAMGGSHGVGVMKVDSLASLKSVLDYVRQDSVVMVRKFIEAQTSARCIVLGGKVIDSIEYQVPPGDFRSNVGDQPLVKPKKFSAEIEKLATDATTALQLEFSGVDIITDHSGVSYVMEVNFPCNFARAQAATGVDIAGQMIDHLSGKITTKV